MFESWEVRFLEAERIVVRSTYLIGVFSALQEPTVDFAPSRRTRASFLS